MNTVSLRTRYVIESFSPIECALQLLIFRLGHSEVKELGKVYRIRTFKKCLSMASLSFCCLMFFPRL